MSCECATCIRLTPPPPLLWQRLGCAQRRSASTELVPSGSSSSGRMWHVQEQQRRLGLCLEALGERAERIATLEADMADMRIVFRGALETAVAQLAEARAAAAGGGGGGVLGEAEAVGAPAATPPGSGSSAAAADGVDAGGDPASAAADGGGAVATGAAAAKPAGSEHAPGTRHER